MKEKLLEVQKKLYENLKDTYKIWGNNVLFDIVNDDFVIKEDKDYNYVSALNYEHQLFKLFEQLSDKMSYEQMLKIFIYSLRKLQEKKITFFDKEQVENFIKELNEEISETINYILEGE